MKTKDLVKLSFYLSIFLVLDYVSNAFNFFRMPQGGVLGLGVIALMIAAYDMGWKKGLLVALVSVILQNYVNPLYVVAFPQLFLDYIFAFGVYGLIPLFGPAWIGVLVVNVLRFISHVLSGVLYFEAGWIASVVYNAWYMVPTLIVSMVIIPILKSRLRLNKS
jgi:thiamine transporter